jgi:hypothetical protein
MHDHAVATVGMVVAMRQSLVETRNVSVHSEHCPKADSETVTEENEYPAWENVQREN